MFTLKVLKFIFRVAGLKLVSISSKSNGVLKLENPY